LSQVDRCPKHVFETTKQAINRMLGSTGIGMKPFHIKDEKDIELVKNRLDLFAPIIPISCVTGEGLGLLKSMLRLLPQRRKHKSKMHRPFEFLIDDIFSVPGVGTIISGFVNCGHWRKGDVLHIGPLKDGSNLTVVPKSCHVAQTTVDHVWAGHSACFAIPVKAKQRGLFRSKGMVALREPVPVTRVFKAEVYFVKGTNVTITKGSYVSTLHILHMKESCRVIGIHGVDGDKVTIRPNERALVTFEFTRRPMHIRKGMRMIVRDGYVRGIGRIVSTDDGE
jgi:GTPase